VSRLRSAVVPREGRHELLARLVGFLNYDLHHFFLDLRYKMPKSDYVNEKGYGPKKGEKRKKKPAGSRLAFDDTPDSKKRPDAAKGRKKTTKKGDARKGKVAGSRLAFDDTKQEKKKDEKPKKKSSGGGWIAHVKAVQKKEGITYKEAMSKASATYKK